MPLPYAYPVSWAPLPQKCVGGWGRALDPDEEAYSAPQTLARFEGPTRGRKGKEGHRKGSGKGAKGCEDAGITRGRQMGMRDERRMWG